MITGDGNKVYEDYFAEKYLSGRSGLKMLSLGTGTCSHEFRFARMGVLFEEVRCLDIAGTVLKKAEELAKNEGLTNIHFDIADVNEITLPANYYDVILFHSSLHHFRGVEQLLAHKIHGALKQEGYLVINEFVGPNRLQFPASQIRAMNQALKIVPVSHRVRLKSRFIKSHISGPGWLRMLLADPSECVESEAILPVLHKYFNSLEERRYGGSLLMSLFKDIAHHFMNDDPQTTAILQQLFAAEDEWLQHHPSDFVFGVYKP